MTNFSAVTLILLLTASGVSLLTIWIVNYHYQEILKEKDNHYQEILREKDTSYWENLGRRQTNDLHCEDQCKRMIDSSNLLISVYEDRLKTLLHTDVQSTQMREESHREVLSLYKNHAVLVSEQKQSSTLHCMSYCQQLKEKLKACNESLESQKSENWRLLQRGTKQQHSIVYTHRLLEQCQSDSEQHHSFVQWMMAGILTTGGILMAVWYSTKQVSTKSEESPQKESKTENEVVARLADESNCRQQLQERLEELERESKLQIDQLTLKLTTAEDELLMMHSHYEAKHTEFEKSLSVREKENQRSQNIIKLLENQREKEQAGFYHLKQEIELKMQQREKQSFQLAKENRTLEEELQARCKHALKAESDLKQLKQKNQSLQRHIQAQQTEISELEARITKTNKKLLQKTESTKRKEKETEKLQLELSKQKELLEQKTKEMQSLQEVHSELKMDITDLNALAIMRLHELERETERKDRALRGHSFREDRIGQLEKLLEGKGRRSTSQKKHKPADDSIEQTRLELCREFEHEYTRFETKIHGEHAALAEEISNLKTENKEKGIKLEKLRVHNKTLQELLDKQHMQERAIKRQKANDRMCRVTFDLYHPSLSPSSQPTVLTH